VNNDLWSGQHRVGVVITAGGQSQRMGGIDKTFALINDYPVIVHSIRPFLESSDFHQIVVVLSKENLSLGQSWVDHLNWGQNLLLCVGGERRQDSVRNGIQMLENCEWIVVHDGARPCIDSNFLTEGLTTAFKFGTAVPVVPLIDTIKTLDDSGFVKKTVPREQFWRVQTPQFFCQKVLSEAHKQISQTVSDDAQMVELLGYKIGTFPGADQNIKITTPEDIPIAKAIITSHVAGIG